GGGKGGGGGGRHRGARARKPHPPQPAGRPPLERDADRRVERAVILPQLPPRGAQRPPLRRRRPQGALLQEVQHRAGRPEQAEQEVRSLNSNIEIRNPNTVDFGFRISDFGFERTVMATARLQERYKSEIVPQLKKKLGRDNIHSIPKLMKIAVNMGVGKAIAEKNRMEQAADQLAQITGQRPQITKSKIAVSGFRLREGMEIGCRVTLRGQRMYEFLDRLISTALPRIRDFRGVNPK